MSRENVNYSHFKIPKRNLCIRLFSFQVDIENINYYLKHLIAQKKRRPICVLITNRTSNPKKKIGILETHRKYFISYN